MLSAPDCRFLEEHNSLACICVYLCVHAHVHAHLCQRPGGFKQHPAPSALQSIYEVIDSGEAAERHARRKKKDEGVWAAF